MSLCLSPSLGGLELYAHRSMQLLREYGYLKLAVVQASTRLQERARLDEIALKSLDARRSWVLSLARSLARTIDGDAIDAIHINWGRDLNLAVLAKRWSKQKPAIVYSRHMRIPGSKRDPYHRWIYRQVDRLIVSTQEMYGQAVNHLPIDRERVHQLYLGVAPPRLPENGACARFLSEGAVGQHGFKIGLFGRVEQAKGQHILIQAVRQLVDSGCNVQAAIVGEATTATFYQSLEQSIIDSALQDRVRLHGFVAEANRLMSCFDVIVLPSYCEHFGLVLIEAMHAGVAVIGTAAGGVPEIIEDGISGLLCTPGSALDLAEKIKRVYDDRSMRDLLAARGQQRAREHFSEARHFEALRNHFEQAVAETMPR